MVTKVSIQTIANAITVCEGHRFSYESAIDVCAYLGIRDGDVSEENIWAFISDKYKSKLGRLGITSLGELIHFYEGGSYID